MKKMSLQNVTVGRLEQPFSLLVYGFEGVGKTTFAANAPAPIFVPTENGTAEHDVARFPVAERWEDVLEALETLRAEPHEYQTLVLDTVNGLEPLCWEYLCRTSGGPKCTGIVDYQGGFGKGHEAAVQEMAKIAALLDRIRTKRRMNLILLGHAHVGKLTLPDGLEYDRYALKMNKKAGPVFKEFVDCALFAQQKTFKSGEHVVTSGRRVLMSERTALYDAKNRYHLPEEMPLDFEVFYSHYQARNEVKALVARLRAMLDRLPDDERDKGLAYLTKIGDQREKLVAFETRLQQKIDVQQPAMEETSE